MTNNRVARGERDDECEVLMRGEMRGASAASEAIDSRYRRLTRAWSALEEAKGLVGCDELGA